MEVFRIAIPESGPASLRSCPIKTDKVSFNVYSFQPWQALAMHRHPGSDEVFYVIEGKCLFYVAREEKLIDRGNAVYVPASTGHAVLSCEHGATLISVQGPGPITSIYGNLEYFCPSCGLETPLPEGTGTGVIKKCPRCSMDLKLIEAGAAFEAVPAGLEPVKEARA